MSRLQEELKRQKSGDEVGDPEERVRSLYITIKQILLGRVYLFCAGTVRDDQQPI